MPIPTPSKDEKQNDFVSRCVSSPALRKEYKDDRQLLAICYSTYRKAKQKKESNGSMEEPSWDEFETEAFDIIP